MQLGNCPPSSFSQYLAGSSGTRLPVALRKVAHRWCNALAQYAFELPLLIRTRSCMQRCRRVWSIKSYWKGDNGRKTKSYGFLFLAQPVLFDIMYLEKLLSAIWVTPSAAWWSWEGFWKQQSVSPGYPLCFMSNIEHISLPSSKSVTVLLEQAVWVLRFCPLQMISCQAATELVHGWDYWSSCLQVFPWYK